MASRHAGRPPWALWEYVQALEPGSPPALTAPPSTPCSRQESLPVQGIAGPGRQTLELSSCFSFSFWCWGLNPGASHVLSTLCHAELHHQPLDIS